MSFLTIETELYRAGRFFNFPSDPRNDGVRSPAPVIWCLPAELRSLISIKNGPSGRGPFFVLDMIVGLVPFRKFPEAFAEGSGGAVAVVFFQGFCVRIGDGDVAGLHGYQFLVGFEVVVFGEDTGAEEFLLEDVYEAEEVFRPPAADVIYGVGREGKTVFAVFLFRRSLHDTDDAFHNVIDVGEVSFAMAVVENLKLNFPGFITGLCLFYPYQQVTGKLNPYDFTASLSSFCPSPAS